MGIEPTRPAWKAGILPLNYTRIGVARMCCCFQLVYIIMYSLSCQQVFSIFLKIFEINLILELHSQKTS